MDLQCTGHFVNTCIQSLGKHYRNLGRVHRAEKKVTLRQETTFIKRLKQMINSKSHQPLFTTLAARLGYEEDRLVVMMTSEHNLNYFQ